MEKWEVASVIAPDLINSTSRLPYVIQVKEEENTKLQKLLEDGFEPFAVAHHMLWLRRDVNAIR